MREINFNSQIVLNVVVKINFSLDKNNHSIIICF